MIPFDLLADTVPAATVRAAIGFVAAIVLFKIAKKRFMRRGTPLDTLLIVIVGAVLGRGIAEGEFFVPTLAAAVVLVALHWILAALAFHVPGLSDLLEGRVRRLVEDGRWDAREMRAALVSEADIAETLRLQHATGDLARIRDVRQERSGKLSIILR